MFDNWTYLEWLILAIDVLAIIIVVRFLSNKIKKKLHEELGKISNRQRREQAKQRSEFPDDE